MPHLLVQLVAFASLILATGHAHSAEASTPCKVAGETWSSGHHYILGGPELYPSVYAKCDNGVATCFNQTNVHDRKHDVIACNDPVLFQEGLFLPQPALRWPKGVACYTIDGVFNEQQRQHFKDAMAEYMHRPKFLFLSLEECRAQSNMPYCNNCQDFFRIVQQENACWAYGGYQPGVQMMLNFGQNCFYDGAFLHELGHIVGLVHEHQHPNREVVVLRNELTVEASQYAKRRDVGSTAYDRKSVMHYARWGGLCVPKDTSKNYCDVVDPEPGCVEATTADCDASQDNTFGVSKSLSDGDVALVDAMYQNNHWWNL